MTSPLIPITGIDATWRVPGAYAEILFAQGPATATAGVREVCLVMPMIQANTSCSGTWTPGTLYSVSNEKDVSDGAGPGSPLHIAAREALRANKNAKLWALPVAETTGGSPIAATWVVTATVGSTNPTATGTLTVTVCGEDATYTFGTSDTATTIGTGIRDAINAKTWLPAVASASGGAVTVTAKLKGLSQGDGTLVPIRCRASVTSGVGVTLVNTGAGLGVVSGAAVAGADGSTTEAAGTNTALGNIASTKKYYLASSSQLNTTLGYFKTHLSTKAEPRQGLRSVAVAGYTHTLAAAQTLANGLNYERIQLAWQKNSDRHPAQIAGQVAAVRQKREQTDSAYNFAGYSAADWSVPAAYATSDWPSASDLNDAINDGITPIASKNGGGSYVVMSVNTRSKNSTGTLDDFRACETHRVSVADEFTDELCASASLNHQGKKFADDEYLADGTVNVNQRYVRGVLKPSQYKPEVFKQLNEFEAAAKIQAIDASKESLRCVKSPANPSRMEVGLDLRTIDHLHQFTSRIAETSVA
jgi:phage tail sheath gpL-like